MSKERLEEIIKQVKRSDEYAEKGLWEASDRMIIHLHNEGHINYLTERVQELETFKEEMENRYEIWHIGARKSLAEKEELKQQIKRYREALEFYADEDNYRVTLNDDYEPILHDDGLIARKALEGEE